MPSGKITKLYSDPRGFRLHDPTTPPPGGTDYDYTPVTVDQLAVASAAYIKGSDCDVTGTAPSCGGVTAK